MSASKHYDEAWGEIYSRGGNPDRLDIDKVYDDYYNGVDPEVTASRELRHQREERQRRQNCWEESEGYYE